jgi:glycerol-3-phosphate dehydrogenase
VLAHRTRLVYEIVDRGTEAAVEVASVVAPLLGWDSSDEEREVRAWQARIEAERHAEEAPDDEAAERARLATPDVAAMQPLRS